MCLLQQCGGKDLAGSNVSPAPWLVEVLKLSNREILPNTHHPWPSEEGVGQVGRCAEDIWVEASESRITGSRVPQSKIWSHNKIELFENMEIMWNKWKNWKINASCPYPQPPLTSIVTGLMVLQYFVVLQFFWMLVLKGIQVYHSSQLCTDLAENQRTESYLTFTSPMQTSHGATEFALYPWQNELLETWTAVEEWKCLSQVSRLERSKRRS